MMLVTVLASAALAAAPPPAPARATATASITIISGAEIHFDQELERGKDRRLVNAAVRMEDGSRRLALLVEFQ